MMIPMMMATTTSTTRSTFRPSGGLMCEEKGGAAQVESDLLEYRTRDGWQMRSS